MKQTVLLLVKFCTITFYKFRKQSLLALGLLILSNHLVVAQNTDYIKEKRTYQYYDEDNKRISESEFIKKTNEKGYYIITSDSLAIQKLTERNQKGKLENKDVLITHLENLTGQDIDDEKPIIIIYHPGKDPCNSSGSAKVSTAKIWTDELEKGTRRIAKITPIYISKVSAELSDRDKVRTWYEDKDQVIEKQFFKYPYPCSSYVIISPKGRFYSQFGEFGKESVWMMLRKMK